MALTQALGEEDVKAYWKNNHTIIIEISKDYPDQGLRYKQVQSFEDVVRIEYHYPAI
jgi:hypothetical protein